VLQDWSKYAIFNERDADKAVTLADLSRAVFNQLNNATSSHSTMMRRITPPPRLGRYNRLAQLEIRK